MNILCCRLIAVNCSASVLGDGGLPEGTIQVVGLMGCNGSETGGRFLADISMGCRRYSFGIHFLSAAWCNLQMFSSA